VKASNRGWNGIRACPGNWELFKSDWLKNWLLKNPLAFELAMVWEETGYELGDTGNYGRGL